MDSQTGRYRLGLASNLIAKQGCLEEMTPFQTLNYNRGLCALKKYAHLNESKPEILFVFRVKELPLISLHWLILLKIF